MAAAGGLGEPKGKESAKLADEDQVRPALSLEPASSQPRERHQIRQIHGKRRRCADRCNQRNPRNHGFLHNLVTDAARDQQHVV